LDNLEDDVDKDESDQDCEDLDDSECEGEVRADWMVLSDGAVFDISSDLGSRIIDRNYDWVSDLRLRCPDIDLTVIPTSSCT
jgi:hypothetical protein